MWADCSVFPFAHNIVQAKSILFPSLAEIIAGGNLRCQCIESRIEESLNKFLHDIPPNIEVAPVPPPEWIVLDIQAIL